MSTAPQNNTSQNPRPKPILVLGLGNILLQDEGVGVHVVEHLLTLDLPDHVELLDGGTAGFDLLDPIADRQKVVIIDAIDGDLPPGTMVRFGLDQLDTERPTRQSLHEVSIGETFAAARRLGVAPAEVVVLGIKPASLSYGLDLSPCLAERIPILVDEVLKELQLGDTAPAEATAKRQTRAENNRNRSGNNVPKCTTARSLLAVLFLLLISQQAINSPAFAAPAWGTNCMSCHGQLETGDLTIFGEDLTADPDESATGAADRGLLPVFQVGKGQTRDLTIEVTGLSEEDRYAVELTRLRFPEVTGGGTLSYVGDCAWLEWKNPGNHYTDPAIGYQWSSGPTTFAFTINVKSQTPPGFYDLLFALAGHQASSGELFYTEHHFYLQVTASPADYDHDGDVDLDDYAQLRRCLAGPNQPAPMPFCFPPDYAATDLDGDGDVDLADFSIFTKSLY